MTQDDEPLNLLYLVVTVGWLSRHAPSWGQIIQWQSGRAVHQLLVPGARMRRLHAILDASAWPKIIVSVMTLDLARLSGWHSCTVNLSCHNKKKSLLVNAFFSYFSTFHSLTEKSSLKSWMCEVVKKSEKNPRDQPSPPPSSIHSQMKRGKKTLSLRLKTKWRGLPIVDMTELPVKDRLQVNLKVPMEILLSSKWQISDLQLILCVQDVDLPQHL